MEDTNDEIVINNKMCLITKMTSKEIYFKIKEEIKNMHESKVKINLYAALLKNEMLDFEVKKAVELGVDTIQLFFSKNVVVNLDDGKKEKKLEKVKKTVVEAVKQCGRYELPEVNEFCMLKNIDLSQNDINIIAYEKSDESFKSTVESIKKEYKNIKSIGVIVGPEGGFDKEEITEILKDKNVKCVSLGSNILRAETAVCKIISIIKYEFDD